MLSKRILGTYKFIVNIGNINGTTAYWWDSHRGEIVFVKSKLVRFRWYINILISVTSTPVMLGGYIAYIWAKGFKFSDAHNILHFVFLGISFVSNVFDLSILRRTEEFARTVNQVLYFFNTLDGKYKGIPASTKYNLCADVFNTLVNFALTLPLILLGLYAFQCDLHIFANAFPQICSEETVLPFPIRMFLIMVQWTFMTREYYAILFVEISLFTYWFYGLDIAHRFNQIPSFTREHCESFLKIHKGLEILKVRINECLGDYLLPIYLGVIMLWIVITLNCTVNGGFDVAQRILMLQGSIVCLSVYLITQYSWQFSQLVEAGFKKCKDFTSDKITDVRINACQHLNVRFGSLGYLDRDKFWFMGDIIISQCMNVFVSTREEI